MAITFVSDQDLRSFCTPAFQFRHRSSVEQFATDIDLAQNSDAYQYFSAGSASYQPRKRFGQLDTSVLDQPYDRDSGRRQTMILRPAKESAPSYNGDAARNTCLMVEGPRRFYRGTRERGHRNGLYHHFAGNDYDCYAVWGRDASHPLGEPLFEEEGRRVYVGRSGCGVLYASVPCFTPTLEVSGYNTHLTLVEFRTLDNTPNRDAILQYSVQAKKQYGYSPVEPCQPWNLDPQKYKPIWLDLAKRAYEGFLASCSQRMPVELGQELRKYKEQMRKSEEDRRKPYGTSYRYAIENMTGDDAFQEALRGVKEPWQLEIVIHHFDGSRFYEDPHYSGARYNRWRKMLEMHTCTEDRRMELNNMAQSFVAPRDNLWNYAGD